MKKTAAALCAIVLTLSACGNGDDEQAKENIKASVLDDEAGGLTGGTKPTEEQADCLADGMVDDVGVETLQRYDLLTEEFEINTEADPTDMEADDAQGLAEVFVGCIDMEEIFASQFAEQDLTEEQQTCITEAIDEDAMKDGLAASFQGKTNESFTAMQEQMMGCVVPDAGGE